MALVQDNRYMADSSQNHPSHNQSNLPLHIQPSQNQHNSHHQQHHPHHQQQQQQQQHHNAQYSDQQSNIYSNFNQGPVVMSNGPSLQGNQVVLSNSSQMQHQNSYSLVPPSGGELMHNRHPYPSPPKPNDLGMDRKLTIDTALASSFPVVGQLTSPANFSPASPSRKSRRNDLFDCGPSFAATSQELNVYSLDKSVSHKLKLTARFDRGFFIANQDWTCYRRNYFQVSACFSSTSNPPAVEVETPCLLEVAPGQFKVATEFMIGLTSQVLATEKKVELIQHTTKRDKGPQLIPSPRTCLPGGVLNTVPGLSFTQNVVTFERLQFKSATANNGKRRAAQQYFIVVVELWARLDDGTSAKVATTTSSPLVVRGRSPGHYADTHERIPSPLFPNTPYDSPYSPTFNNAYGSFNPYSQMQGQSQYSPVSPMNGLMSPTTPTVTNNPYVMNPIPTPTSDTSDNSNGGHNAAGYNNFYDNRQAAHQEPLWSPTVPSQSATPRQPAMSTSIYSSLGLISSPVTSSAQSQQQQQQPQQSYSSQSYSNPNQPSVRSSLATSVPVSAQSQTDESNSSLKEKFRQATGTLPQLQLQSSSLSGQPSQQVHSADGYSSSQSATTPRLNSFSSLLAAAGPLSPALPSARSQQFQQYQSQPSTPHGSAQWTSIPATPTTELAGVLSGLGLNNMSPLGMPDVNNNGMNMGHSNGYSHSQ